MGITILAYNHVPEISGLIEKVKTEHFDLMILDFMMDPIRGDEVVEEIRKFNKGKL